MREPTPPRECATTEQQPLPSDRNSSLGVLAVALVLLVLAVSAALVPRASGEPVPSAAPGRRSDPAAGSRPPAGYTRLVFGDDFDGGRLDGRRWLASRDGARSGPFNPHREAAYFDPEAVTVEDGRLRMTLQEAPDVKVWGRTYQWSSGAVSTADRFSVGDESFVAARVKLPVSDGLWPSFWLAAPDRWPPETDIFEYFGTHKQSRPKFNYHPPTGKHTGPEYYGEEDVDYRVGWHTYGLLRQDGVLTPYVDGIAYPEASVVDQDDLSRFLVLNLSLYRGHQPSPGSALQVDWVKVWER